MPDALRGRQIVLAGGSGGLGSAAAEMLVAEGARVVVSYRARAGRAERWSESAAIVQADLSSAGDRARLLDKAPVTKLGMRVLRTPVRAPRANAICERLGGSLRRECLDFLIPFNERHLRTVVQQWGIHHNRGRPHSSIVKLGPGFPESNPDSIPATDHTQVARRLPRCEDVCAWRLAPRIQPGEGCRLMTDSVLADHRPHERRKTGSPQKFVEMPIGGDLSVP